MPHQPLDHDRARAQFGRQKAAGLVGEIDQDRAGLEHRERPAAVGWRVIDDRRNPVVRADRQKFRLELLAGADVDGNDRVGNAEFLQHDRDFPAVGRWRVMKVDHGVSAKWAGLRSYPLLSSHSTPGNPMYLAPRTWH